MRLHRALVEAIEAEFGKARRKLVAGDALHAFGSNIGAFERRPIPSELQGLIAPER